VNDHNGAEGEPRPVLHVGGGLVAASQRVVWVLGAVIAIIVLFRLSPLPLEHAFVIFFVSILLAAAVAPAASLVGRYHVPRALTILIIYLLALGVLAGAGLLLVPLISSEIRGFEQSLPTYVAHLQTLVARIDPNLAGRLSAGSIAGQATGALTSAATEIKNITIAIVQFAIDIVLILVMAFFMANEEDFAVHVVTRFIPERARPRANRILSRMGEQLGGWVRAQLLLATYFGVAFGIGLWLLGINYAATLGVVGGILEIIPYVGGFVTMVLAVLVALTRDPLHALFALGWYAVVAEIEGQIVHPTLMNRFVHLHPLVVVVALFLGGESLGIVGALLAVPIAVVIQVLLDEFYALPPAPTVEPEKAPSAIRDAAGELARRIKRRK
jgi:predicted PurR-regulated permease PerM